MDVHPAIRHAPDPDHPGWWSWDVVEDDRFNSALGKLLVRADGAGRATCRMFPERRHSNLGDMVHGGAILTFIDMAFFAAGRLAGADVMRAVTLDCSVRFLSPGRIGAPLDAEVELLRETKRLAFFSGKVVQEGELVASFSGALRKASNSSLSAERMGRGTARSAVEGPAASEEEPEQPAPPTSHPGEIIRGAVPRTAQPRPGDAAT